MLPGVCPGVWMILGEPGASSVSPSVTVARSVAGRIRKPPWRAEYHKKPVERPDLHRTPPRIGLLHLQASPIDVRPVNMGGETGLSVQVGREADVVAVAVREDECSNVVEGPTDRGKLALQQRPVSGKPCRR